MKRIATLVACALLVATVGGIAGAGGGTTGEPDWQYASNWFNLTDYTWKYGDTMTGLMKADWDPPVRIESSIYVDLDRRADTFKDSFFFIKRHCVKNWYEPISVELPSADSRTILGSIMMVTRTTSFNTWTVTGRPVVFSQSGTGPALNGAVPTVTFEQFDWSYSREEIDIQICVGSSAPTVPHVTVLYHDEDGDPVTTKDRELIGTFSGTGTFTATFDPGGLGDLGTIGSVVAITSNKNGMMTGRGRKAILAYGP